MPATPLPTWAHSDRFLARRFAQPVQRFLHVESAGGIVLLAATVAALMWANSPWRSSYESFWHTELTLSLGDRQLTEDLRHWVNDGLMALFFFVVGLEIKQELVTGQLAKARDAALPAFAALGGMVVPAAIYAALNRGDATSGWGIPMATDIAFAVGVLALLGSRVPSTLKVLLLALAIVDDIGAIAVIALFYSDGIDLGWGALAVAGIAIIVILAKVRVWFIPVYGMVGSAVWLATLLSGVHATIAGVLLGLLSPARPLLGNDQAAAIADELSEDRDVTVGEVRVMAFRLRESVSVAERLQDVLHPWTSYVIVPIFALANAGISLSADSLRDAVSSPVTIGVVLGLVVGKAVGITGAVAIATRLGIARLPEGIRLAQVAGIAALAGIGYTVALFISSLAFDDAALEAQAKIGVLAASVLAAVIGSAALLRVLPANPPPKAATALPDSVVQGELEGR